MFGGVGVGGLEGGGVGGWVGRGQRVFVATNVCLSRQKFLFCRDK